MQVKEKMLKNVELVEAGLKIGEAQQKMDEQEVGFLPVYDGKCMCGILAARDIHRYQKQHGAIPGDLEVKDIMMRDIKYVQEDHELSEVLRLMREQNRSEVLVVGKEKGLRGILSLEHLGEVR